MGLFSKVGGLLNDITGASSAGKQNQKYALQSMSVQNAYEKEAAQNAHQWEVKDLKEAGLNPILSAGGSGASADTGLTAGSQNSGGISPLDIIGGLTSAKATWAQAKNIDQDTKLKEAQTLKTMKESKWYDSLSHSQKQLFDAQYDKAMTEIAYIGGAQTAKTWSEAEYNKRKASGKGIKLGPIGGNW